MLTGVAIGVVLVLPLVMGMVVCRLLNGERPLAEADWIDAPFVGGALIVIVLQTAWRLGLPVGVTIYPFLMLCGLFATWVVARSRRRGGLGSFPAIPYLIALCAYVTQGLGLFIVGADRYLGRGWGDQFNYIAIAEFLTNRAPGDIAAPGLQPLELLAASLLNLRIGQSILHAAFSLAAPGGTKELFEPTIVWSVFLTALAVYAIARRIGLPRTLALATAWIASTVPALASVHLESFLSQALALPYLFYLFLLLGRVAETNTLADYLKSGLVFAGAAAMYVEFVPFFAVCVLLLLAVRMFTWPVAWRHVAATALLLVVPVAIGPLWTGLSGVMSYVDASLLGHIYPWALTVEGVERLWFGDLVSDAAVSGAWWVRGAALLLTAFGYIGLVHHAALSIAAGSREHRASRVVLALCLLGIAAAPLAVLIKAPDRGYQFYKLLLTATPLLVCGLGIVAWRVWLGIGRMVPAGVAAMLIVALVGVPAASGTLDMVLASTATRLSVAQNVARRQTTGITLEPEFARVQQLLESARGKHVVICATDDTWNLSVVSGWLTYFARHNQTWVLNPRFSDRDLNHLSAGLGLGDPLGRAPDRLPAGSLLVTAGPAAAWLTPTLPIAASFGRYAVYTLHAAPAALVCDATARPPEVRRRPDLDVPLDARQIVLFTATLGAARLVADVQHKDPETMSRTLVLSAGTDRAKEVPGGDGLTTYELGLEKAITRLTFHVDDAGAINTSGKSVRLANSALEFAPSQKPVR